MRRLTSGAAAGVVALALEWVTGVPPAPAQDVLLESTTRMVEVSVLVRDGSGHPVTALTQDDFTIEDEGRPQKIVAFGEITPPRRDTASNRAPRTITVMLLDGVNQPAEYQIYARDQVIRWLRGAALGGPVAIFAAHRELRLLHDLTENREALIEALMAYKPQSDVEFAALDVRPSAEKGEHDSARILNRNWNDYRNARRSRITNDALRRVVRYLEALRGRKNLIWVTSDIPLAVPGVRGNEAFRQDSSATLQAMSNAGITLYPVHARGLQQVRAASDENRMDWLARVTGGRAFYGNNDLAGAFADAAGENGGYVLGYYPDHGQWDDRFRTIRVRTRKAGATVQHRSGYIASAKPARVEDPEHAARGTIEQVLASSRQVTGIGLECRLGQHAGTPRVFLRIDGHDLTVTERDGHWQGRIELLIATGNSRQSSFEGKPLVVNLSWTPEVYATVKEQGLRLERDIDPSAAADELRIAVKDVLSGRAGSLVTPWPASTVRGGE